MNREGFEKLANDLDQGLLHGYAERVRVLLAAGTEGPGLLVSFVQGAKWWEFETTGATMWQSDQQKAWDEAERRAKNGNLGILDPLARSVKGDSNGN